MAEFKPKKVTANDFNNGNKYRDFDSTTGYEGDTPRAVDFNNVIESQLFVQGLGNNQPDTINANNVGTPNVEIITASDGSAQLKFSNLKGEKGQDGVQGADGEQGKGYYPRGLWNAGNSYLNTNTTIDVVLYNGTSYYCKVSNASETTPDLDSEHWGVFSMRGKGIKDVQLSDSGFIFIYDDESTTAINGGFVDTESINILSTVNAGDTNLVTGGAVYNAVDRVDTGKKTVLSNITSVTLMPDVYYDLGIVTDLTITFGTSIAGRINEYKGIFETRDNPNVTFPSSVRWVGGSTIAPDKIYQFSIVDNIGVIVSV